MNDARPDSSPPFDEESLTESVSEVSGVTEIYAPTAIVTQIPQLISAVTTGNQRQLNRVALSSVDGATTLTVRLGVDTDAPTPETAARVADALLDRVSDDNTAIVQVEVARISSGRRPG